MTDSLLRWKQITSVDGSEQILISKTSLLDTYVVPCHFYIISVKIINYARRLSIWGYTYGFIICRESCNQCGFSPNALIRTLFLVKFDILVRSGGNDERILFHLPILIPTSHGGHSLAVCFASASPLGTSRIGPPTGG